MKFPRLFSRNAPAPQEIKESAASRVLMVNPGQPAWMPREYGKFAREGYTQNVVAYQAINKLAEAVALPKPLLFKGDKEITGSPLLDLLARPNPMQDFSSYIQALVGFLLLSGNGYAEKIMVGQTPRELYALRSDRMKVIPSQSGFPAGFAYEVGGRKATWDFDPANVLASPVWQIKLFNPLNDWYGLSPIEAAAWAVDQHNQSQAWVQALLQNSARPSGALVVGGDGELSDEQFNRLKAQIEDQHQGAANAGRPMLLEGGLDWKQMGLSPDDMNILETRNASAREICLAFGVPPQLLGIPGDNTYSNYKEARLAFWEDSVIPLIQMIYGALNVWLTPHFGEGLELRPNLEDVPAIVDKRMTLWEMANASDDLTIDERRELKGYEPLPGGMGNAVLVPGGMVPLGMDDNAGINGADVKALARVIGYPDNVTPMDRKAKP